MSRLWWRTNGRTDGRKVENRAVFCWTRNRNRYQHIWSNIEFKQRNFLPNAEVYVHQFCCVFPLSFPHFCIFFAYFVHFSCQFLKYLSRQVGLEEFCCHSRFPGGAWGRHVMSGWNETSKKPLAIYHYLPGRDENSVTDQRQDWGQAGCKRRLLAAAI